MEMIRKIVEKNYNDCDSHLTKANLVQKIEIEAIIGFYSLTDDLFELGY